MVHNRGDTGIAASKSSLILAMLSPQCCNTERKTHYKNNAAAPAFIDAIIEESRQQPVDDIAFLSSYDNGEDMKAKSRLIQNGASWRLTGMLRRRYG